MALVPLASKGHFMHVFDFRVLPGEGDAFITLFEAFDYSDDNPMHKSSAQIKDGVLCRDTNDPDHFYLIGEWNDIVVHAAIGKQIAMDMKPEFLRLVEGGRFMPIYAEVVSSTPQDILDKAS
ncbi:hypothetical protein [Pigmentiphaga litoralis]|uniref:Quinol monooxygenase YgiN n=1 Tax=Pigmentiphaga litoralis TaxID=516702 RepID=A0A7Y9IUH6_9BURK|nr:hypothetical protein [Pigmentiphaga litoralis]NYE23202.1 hypothetical protein [Pigmentiphaga litoralis]NYE83184.1 hypothetical protein [Pigmentiphaga litoralis]